MSAMSDSAAGGQDGDNCAPVDFVWLRECTDNDADAMKSLLDLFFNRTATLLNELDTAVGAGNAAEVRRLGHACAGSSGACGMVKLMPLFKELERLGTSGTVDGAAPIAAVVRSEFNRAKAFIDGTVIG
jgi:HPt (histidine-containing phosphotransfer) domain-containing protein